MILDSPHKPDFGTLKQLVRRLNADRTDRKNLISVSDHDVPEWQRKDVWSPVEKGLLAYSILQNYPIGMMILWRKPNGVRVPIDGRQRLTAIREFAAGRIPIPALPSVMPVFHNKKYQLLDGDQRRGFTRLEVDHLDVFDGYEPALVQFDDIDEDTAMDMFSRLQWGKSLTNAEVRAALGGRLCEFVTELTGGSTTTGDIEAEPDEAPAGHKFFREIYANIRNTRKAHRNLCDILLHEHLNPDTDKHWSSLDSMYRDKRSAFPEASKKGFRATLTKFMKSVEMKASGKTIIIPQLRTTYLVLTFFKACQELSDSYALPATFSFAKEVKGFETQRVATPDEVPWVNFSAALSNAGYAKQRIQIRHKILMSHVLRRHPNLELKDKTRSFSDPQKIAIWDRAQARCECVVGGKRCPKMFDDFRQADADHIVKWSDAGPTSIANGRLLCRPHNRSRKCA